MNCITYARVSTERQAERELSLPAQEQAMRDYAKRQGWTIAQEFVEPGASGRSAERPILKELLSRCRKTPKIDVVLVHKIDRLARNVFDHATIRAFLKQRAIRLASVVENVDDTITGQLVENIMASIAQFYSANLGEETKKGMRMMVEKGGWPHRPPKGYQMVRGEDGRSKPEPDDAQSPLVQRAFELYATGTYSLNELSAMLATEGLLTSRGNPIPIGYLRDMLENPFYCGRIRWMGKDYPGHHKPIISKEQYERVVAVLRSRYKNPGKKGKYHFFLRGVAVCAACGAKMTAEKHDRWSYYRCIAHTRRQCSARFSNVERTHESLRALYQRLKLSARLRTMLQEAGEDLITDRHQAQKQRLNSLRTQKVRLGGRQMQAAEAFADGQMTAEVYRALAPKMQREMEAIDLGMAEAKIDPGLAVRKLQQVFGTAASLWELHQAFDELGQHRMIRIVFKELVLEEGEVVGYVLRSPFDRLLTTNAASDDRPDDSAPGATEPPPDELRHLVITALVPAIRSILEVEAATADVDVLPQQKAA